VWWYRHPGIKRLDFSPGDEIPARRKNGQPKTLAEALTLLEAERARAADLEDAAKRAQTQEGVLRNELTVLRDELTEERTKLATLRDELSAERKKQAESDLLWRKAEERADEMEASYNSLADDLEKAEEYTSELEEDIESVRRRAEDVRYDLEQEISQLRRELDEQMPSKERASAEQEELKRQFEELRIRFEENAQSLILRDGELKSQQQNFDASARAHHEIHHAAESMTRSLDVEKERRIAAERRVEQLALALDRVSRTGRSVLSEAEQLALLDLRDSCLSAELQETRLHRDVAVAERELVVARILRLRRPGIVATSSVELLAGLWLRTRLTLLPRLHRHNQPLHQRRIPNAPFLRLEPFQRQPDSYFLEASFPALATRRHDGRWQRDHAEQNTSVAAPPAPDATSHRARGVSLLLPQPHTDLTQTEPFGSQLLRQCRRCFSIKARRNVRSVLPHRVHSFAIEDDADSACSPCPISSRWYLFLVQSPCDFGKGEPLSAQELHSVNHHLLVGKRNQNPPPVCIPLHTQFVSVRSVSEPHSLRLHVPQRVPRALRNHLPFKLRVVRQVHQHHPSCRRVRVRHSAQRQQVIALVPKVILDERADIAQRAGQSVQLHDDQGIRRTSSEHREGCLQSGTFQSPARDPLIGFYVDEFYAVEFAVCL
jgi:hypothetical protein